MYSPTVPPEIAQRLALIRCLILDADGVLTDGGMYYDAKGEVQKRFHVHDGLGIKLLQSVNIRIAIISARLSAPVASRAAELAITDVYQNSHDKSASLDELTQALNITPQQCAFIGDDIIDLPILRRVGLACCPSNAHPAVLPFTHFQTQHAGGDGAIREVADMILAAQNLWSTVVQRYLPALI